MRTVAFLLFPSLALAGTFIGGQFKLPDGWTDVTHDAAKVPGIALDAVAPDSTTHLQATIEDRGTRIDALNLAGWAKGLEIGLSEKSERISTDSKLVDFNGVQVMRVVLRGEPAAAVCYQMPMGERTGTIIFTTEFAKLAEYEPVFEATARATSGLAKSGLQSDEVPVGSPRLAGGIIGALVVLVVVGFVIRRSRRSS
jgi:hypothetical protein